MDYPEALCRTGHRSLLPRCGEPCVSVWTFTKGFHLPFHPQTNGQDERTNQTMKQVLRILEAQRHTRDCMALITLVEIAINYAPLETTEYIPFFLNYDYHQIFHWDIADAMEVARTEPLEGFITRMITLWA